MKQHLTLGAQLYTVRDYAQNERDLAYTLEQIAALGYEEVQVSGIGPIAPRRVRALCDANGLKIVLTHAGADRLLQSPEALIEENDILGCDCIGLGGLPPRYIRAEWVDRFAGDFAPTVEKLRRAGKRFLYHHHGFEFQKLPDGRRILEVFLDAFSPAEMGVTLDTYWAHFAGADVPAWIDKLQGRLDCVHLKDMSVQPRVFDNVPVMMPVGEGNMNFEAILAKLTALGETRHYLVEQDFWDESPFACLEKSYRNLRAMGY